MGVNQRGIVTMSETEIAKFLERERTATLATIGPAGEVHLVAMWYALVDRQIWLETKMKSQKAVNLRRDNRVSLLVEGGLTYETLQGVSFEGRALLSDDAADLWRVGVSVYERYVDSYSEDVREQVDAMMHNRVAIRIDIEHVRSWDHRKLGMAPTPLGGTTAEFVGRGR
jgi:PPOX class probable F420-dependent enzyme